MAAALNGIIGHSTVMQELQRTGARERGESIDSRREHVGHNTSRC